MHLGYLAAVSEESNQTGAGCGLAAYALILLGLCLVGVLGIVLSTMNLINQQPDEISRLVHGSEVPVWRLQPMREAGALELTEVPLAWHDESPYRDGTTVCALRPGTLVRVESGTATSLRFENIVELEVTRDDTTGRATITAVGPTHNVACHFMPKEGGDKFFQQLRTESDKVAGTDNAPKTVSP
jgi:hypothetical protein